MKKLLVLTAVVCMLLPVSFFQDTGSSMPTLADWQELKDKCTWAWITPAQPDRI